MKALPFPCIRPAQDRVLEALPAMGSILSGNDALRGAIADGLMLKDPGAAYYVYECSGEPGRVTGVVAICPVNVLTGGDEAAAESIDALATARAIAELKVQPRPVSLAYEASPVMDIILSAAKEGASLYAVTDPAGVTHRVWEVKREDAVAAMVDAISEVRDGEVTRAVRDSSASDGSPIHSGDVMGIIAGSIDVVGSDVKQVTLDCINRMQEEEEGDALTILAGEELSDEAFQEIVDAIEEAQPDLEIDAHRGEQPLYPVIFSIE